MHPVDFYAKDIIMGIGSFMEAVWEINVVTEQVYIWSEKVLSDRTNQILPYNELFSFFLSNYICEPDRKVWRQYMSLDVLKDLIESGKKNSSFEIRILGEPLGVDWYEIFCTVISNEESANKNVMMCFRNISDKKRSAIIETAVQSEYDYVIYLEADDNSYVMYSSNETSGTPLPPAARNDYTLEMMAYNTQFCTPDESIRLNNCMQIENVLKNVRKDGEYILYSKMWENDQLKDKKLRFSFFDIDKNILLLTRTDITEIREEKRQKTLLQDALHAANAANQAKSEFLSRMSHDIRTPMNAIIGMTAIAGAHINEKERILDCLSKITLSSKLLLSLINEVLDMSKIESGRIVLAEEEANLSDLLQNLMAMVQSDIAAKEHTLDVHLYSIRHEDVICDTQRIQQLLMNLLSNAIKYTPQKGHLLLEIRELPSQIKNYGCYEFIFEDNGIGMKPEFTDRIFEPFERADDQEIREIQGTGLGMAISKNIVHMMDGDIQVESTYGKGSRFTVKIHLQYKESINRDTIRDLNDLPVLVVDDDQIVCETTCSCLNEIGLNSEWVLSGEEAVVKTQELQLRKESYFAIILDLNMPGINGIETARRIRKIAGPDVTIILLSAYDWSEYESQALSAGIDGFILKPLFKSRLIYMLKKFVQKDKIEEHISATSIGSEFFPGKRILLAEDNELNREIAMEILGSTGIEVEPAVNGREALDKFQNSQPGYYNLIFMDIQMPVMNGYETTRSIRALSHTDAKTIPIIAMTANAFAKDVDMALQSGMNYHLAKPLDIPQIMNILNKWL